MTDEIERPSEAVQDLLEVTEVSNIVSLSKFVRALQLLGEVYNEGTGFTDNLMPASTEQFLTESVEVLNKLEAGLESAVL